MTQKLTRVVATLLALTVVGGAAVGAGAAAASDGSVSADPTAPGETSTHTVTATAGGEATGSWNGLSVDYSNADADLSEVGEEDVANVGIDRGDDTSGDGVDVNVSDDLSSVQTSNNGETLTFGFGGSYDVDEGDEVVVVFEDATNPSSAGEYETPLEINPQSSGGQTTAMLNVGDAGDATTTDDAGDDEGDATTDGPLTTTGADSTAGGDDGGDSGDNTGDSDNGDTGDNTGDSDNGGSGGFAPGFGVGIALVSLVAAALLAVRE